MQLMFGLDNYLYLMLGDGGSAGDPQNNAQNMSVSSKRFISSRYQSFNLNTNRESVVFTSNNTMCRTTWLGKALRIDVNTRAPGKEYGIPPDNPFVGDPVALEEIYASGFRNPWRVHQDAGDRITGTLINAETFNITNLSICLCKSQSHGGIASLYCVHRCWTWPHLYW